MFLDDFQQDFVKYFSENICSDSISTLAFNDLYSSRMMITEGKNQKIHFKSDDTLRYFYQSADGQEYFLSPNSFKYVQEKYQEPHKFPLEITGKILSIVSLKLDDYILSRMKFLRHLPYGITVNLVDIQFCK